MIKPLRSPRHPRLSLRGKKIALICIQSKARRADSMVANFKGWNNQRAVGPAVWFLLHLFYNGGDFIAGFSRKAQNSRNNL